MTLTDWRDNLDVLGPDLTRWPSGLVQQALDLLETSDEAKDLFARASASACLDGERASGATLSGDRLPARP